MSNLFTADDLIYTYTRQQAIEDGVLVDANIGDLAEITRQFFKIPVTMTAAVFALIEKAVKHPTHCNDFRGVWHDITWMCYLAARRNTQPQLLFKVIITGTGRTRNHVLKAVMGPLSPTDPAPCMTIMLPDED